MALTITTPDNAGGIPSAPSWTYRVNAVLDNSYPTGGYLLGLQAIIGAGKTIGNVVCVGKVTSSGAADFTHTYTYNRVTDKLMAGVISNAPAEVANTTDLSTVTVELDVAAY